MKWARREWAQGPDSIVMLPLIARFRVGPGHALVLFMRHCETDGTIVLNVYDPNGATSDTTLMVVAQLHRILLRRHHFLRGATLSMPTMPARQSIQSGLPLCSYYSVFVMNLAALNGEPLLRLVCSLAGIASLMPDGWIRDISWRLIPKALPGDKVMLLTFNDSHRSDGHLTPSCFERAHVLHLDPKT